MSLKYYVQPRAPAHSLNYVQFFVTPWIIAQQAPLSMEFSRQEHWSGVPFPTPGDLPDPGIKHVSLASPAMAGRFFTTVPTGKPRDFLAPSLTSVISLCVLTKNVSK